MTCFLPGGSVCSAGARLLSPPSHSPVTEVAPPPKHASPASQNGSMVGKTVCRRVGSQHLGGLDAERAAIFGGLRYPKRVAVWGGVLPEHWVDLLLGQVARGTRQHERGDLCIAGHRSKYTTCDWFLVARELRMVAHQVRDRVSSWPNRKRRRFAVVALCPPAAPTLNPAPVLR